MDLETLREWQKSGREALAAQMAPETANDEERTIDIVWYTGTPVARYSYIEGPYTLEFDPKGADLSYLNSNAPLLDNHWMFGHSDQKGCVVRAWAEGNQYMATVRLSKRPEVDGLWRDMRDGIVCKFSMGVEILESIDKRDKDGSLETRTATRWRPFELSIAPVPADFNTKTLSAEHNAAPAEARASETNHSGATPQQETSMKETLNAGVETPKPETASQAGPVEVPEVDVKVRLAADRKRIVDIDGMLAHGLKMGLPADQIASMRRELVESDATPEQAGTRVLAALAAHDATQPETHGHRAEMTRDETVTRREAMANALLHRFAPDAYKLESGRQYRGFTLIELARECVGMSTRGMSKNEIARLALHGTSDFPAILENVATKTLRNAYEQAPRTFVPIARRVSAADFKTMNRVQLGEAPILDKVAPSGEFARGTIGESKATLKVETYGKVLALNRQTIVNDDLDAFTRVPALFGSSAANKESDIVWALVTANAAMADSVAIFHATHKNLASSGAAISVDTVGAGRAAMGKQVGIDKKTILNIRPKFLVVPAALETKAEQFVSANLLPATTAAVVPVSLRSLTPVSEPRLDTNSETAWYLFGDPNQIDTIEYAYLEGEEGAYIETRQGFDVDGVEIKCRLDFGASVIDYRGMYKNVGG